MNEVEAIEVEEIPDIHVGVLILLLIFIKLLKLV